MNPRKRKKAPKPTGGNETHGTDSKRRKIGEHGVGGLSSNINRMNVDYGTSGGQRGHDMASYMIDDGSANSQAKSKPKVKSTPSRSLSNLAKVNTKGMKSMMSFFKPKAKK